MATQSHIQTEEELGIAITLLTAVSMSTEDEVFDDWHQSLQGTIQSLINTVHLLQKQTAFNKLKTMGGV